jgi:N6-adenosine-specific RNA methylase IME4
VKVDIFSTDKKYNIIYADPPWEYKQSGSKTNSRGMAKQHYHTMSTEDICKLPIRQLATDDSLCFMWATFPNIDQALKVMQEWGFEYKTAAFVWVKKNKKSNTNFWGMGAYTRANAEVCLLGISKNTKAKQCVKSHAVHQIFEQLVESPIEEHSKKPDEVRQRILQLLGDIPRIELFARQYADGWDCWANEV